MTLGCSNDASRHYGVPGLPPGLEPPVRGGRLFTSRDKEVFTLHSHSHQAAGCSLSTNRSRAASAGEPMSSTDGRRRVLL